MVTVRRADRALADPAAPPGTGPLLLRIDGGRALTKELVTELGTVCERAEDGDANRPGAGHLVLLRVSGVPGPGWSDGLPVALVSKWERGLRRLERVPAVTVAVADGDCGGTALDALLVADYRITTQGARLVMPVAAGATWPGMALYRLTRQAAGTALARRAILFGTPIGAAQAQAMGIIDDVAGDTAVALDKAIEVASTVSGAELAVRRQLMLEAMTTTFEDALGVHLAACDRALRAVAAGAE